MAVTSYSATPGSNTSISGINIDEGCAPGNVNGAFRQMMADVRVMYDGLPSLAAYMPVAGGTFSGTQPIYTGRGAMLHNNNPAHTSGRVFVQASGGATPSGMASGDFLFEY